MSVSEDSLLNALELILTDVEQREITDSKLLTASKVLEDFFTDMVFEDRVKGHLETDSAGRPLVYVVVASEAEGVASDMDVWSIADSEVVAKKIAEQDCEEGMIHSNWKVWKMPVNTYKNL